MSTPSPVEVAKEGIAPTASPAPRPFAMTLAKVVKKESERKAELARKMRGTARTDWFRGAAVEAANKNG